ncbi:MAG: DUF2339 domain-containing protein, partial [Methylococcaceae bacterium]|nr:DUF2339 domain-containing protein [Methylococcaceae bacterium]
MQWIFMLIGAFLGAVVDEDYALAGAFVGFVFGHFISVPRRIKKLELRLDDLQLELNQLKHQASTKTKVDKVTEPPPQTAAEPPPQETSDEHVSFIKPQVVETKVETSEQDPWFSDNKEKEKEKTEKKEPKVEFVEPEAVYKEIEPTAIEKLFQFIWSWFTDGNTFVRVGIVILFIGVSFLLNFAIDKGFIPIELRLAAVSGFAIFLLSIGWKLREKRVSYALLIQGGGVGLLYLTIFASFSLYKVLPAPIAFGFLVIIVVLSAILAIQQNALSLALFGVIGGFLAPILTSTGSNNYIGLFSFYALLNAGILAIAWHKAWKVLNLVGFSFTFSISSFWGASRYQPENFSTIEPFLILFFLFYVGIAILYASRRAVNFKDYVDGTLIFGTPIIAFGMQAAIVSHYEYGVAISAFVTGAFYLILARWCWKNLGENLRFLSETLLSVSVIFATLAIPFAVGGATTSGAWAVEATGILWVSIRQ